MAFYARAATRHDFEDGIEMALRRLLADPKFIYRLEAEPGVMAPASSLSHQRSGARVAAVVLPVEQHSRTRSC